MPSKDARPVSMSKLWFNADVPVKQLRRLTGAPMGPCVFARRKSTLRRALMKLKGELPTFCFLKLNSDRCYWTLSSATAAPPASARYPRRSRSLTNIYRLHFRIICAIELENVTLNSFGAEIIRRGCHYSAFRTQLSRFAVLCRICRASAGPVSEFLGRRGSTGIWKHEYALINDVAIVLFFLSRHLTPPRICRCTCCASRDWMLWQDGIHCKQMLLFRDSVANGLKWINKKRKLRNFEWRSACTHWWRSSLTAGEL